MIKQPRINALLLGLFLLGCAPQGLADPPETTRTATQQAAADVLAPLVAEVLEELDTGRLVAELQARTDKRVLVAAAASKTTTKDLP